VDTLLITGIGGRVRESLIKSEKRVNLPFLGKMYRDSYAYDFQ